MMLVLWDKDVQGFIWNPFEQWAWVLLRWHNSATSSSAPSLRNQYLFHPNMKKIHPLNITQGDLPIWFSAWTPCTCSHTYSKALFSRLDVKTCDIVVGPALVVCQRHKAGLKNKDTFHTCKWENSCVITSVAFLAALLIGRRWERGNTAAQKSLKRITTAETRLGFSFLLLKFLGSRRQMSRQQALAHCRPLTDRPTAEQRWVECQTFVS